MRNPWLLATNIPYLTSHAARTARPMDSIEPFDSMISTNNTSLPVEIFLLQSCAMWKHPHIELIIPVKLSFLNCRSSCTFVHMAMAGDSQKWSSWNASCLSPTGYAVHEHCSSLRSLNAYSSAQKNVTSLMKCEDEHSPCTTIWKTILILARIYKLMCCNLHL